MEQKRIFNFLLAALAIMLVLLPFVTTLNSVLTELINKISFYRTIQRVVVPFESRLVIVITRRLGVPAFLAPAGKRASFYLLKGTQYFPVQLQWNCLGWQSLLLLFLSLAVGLQGNFTKISKLECTLIGLLGTFLINIFRIAFITIGIYYVNTIFAFLIHDYFAAIVTIVWLIFFWWFAYTFVLEKKTGSGPEG